MESSPRSCGSCSACCKLLDIPELEKPHGVWCRHCDPGHGCKIHPDRPQVCRDYECWWLKGFGGDEWFPAKAKIMVDHVTVDGGPVVRFTVDPGYPGRWRELPYIYVIRLTARRGLQGDRWRTVVSVGGQWTLILGDKEVPYRAGTLVRGADGAIDLIAAS